MLGASGACLLVGPTVLAFFSGGYFAEPRLIAAIVAWALVLALCAVGPAPLPLTTAGRVALAGLVLLTLWSALSITWAPVRGPAVDNVQRLVLYVGALMTAIGALREPRVLRAAEPALAAGATAVIAYGLSERLLPGIVELARSNSAAGRLEQPITYWNAEGAMAAFGLVLCARLAGDHTRALSIRAAAAAAVAPLGAGVYLSYSRGAIAAAVVGLVVLVAAAPSRGQVRAVAIALAGAVCAAGAAAAFPGPASLEGTLDDRVLAGAAVLAILVVLAAAAALATVRAARRGVAHEAEPLPWSRRLVPAAAAALAAVIAGLVVGALGERPSRAELAAGAAASRLTTASSNRYEYWRVGLRAFERRPLAGAGSGGFRVEWLRERSFPETVKDAHSLEVELAAELGLVGLVAFALLLGGMIAAARRALDRRRPAAAGACAATLVWLVHASIDWDWQLPAVTLPAIALAGALIALSETPHAGPAGSRPASPAICVAR